MNVDQSPPASLSPAQQALNDLWEEHMRYEFATSDADVAAARGQASR
jgi:hypothetical protein